MPMKWLLWPTNPRQRSTRKDPGRESSVAQVTTMDTRTLDGITGVIEIKGDLTSACEESLMQAYASAGGEHLRNLVLNFTGLEYMNSRGIGLVVTLLVRAHRHKQRMLVYGLSQHY